MESLTDVSHQLQGFKACQVPVWGSKNPRTALMSVESCQHQRSFSTTKPDTGALSLLRSVLISGKVLAVGGHSCGFLCIDSEQRAVF